MANTYPRNMILCRRVVVVVGKIHANSVDVCIIHKYDKKIKHLYLFALVSKILLLSIIIIINKWKRKM